MRGLEGKVAVVTGGAGGIGQAICRRLAEEGAAVVVGDLDAAQPGEAAEQLPGAGARVIGLSVDVADPQSVAELFATAVDRFGGVDVLVTVAANMFSEVLGRDSDAVEVPLELFDPTMHVNVLGTVLSIRHAVPSMLQRGGGAIVCVSSAAAFIGEPERVFYGASKAAITALTRHVASRWGRAGIRANAVAPGYVPRSEGAATEGVAAKIRSEVRSPRLGRGADVAALTAFLASDDAEWINGQVISVDGGWLMR